MKIVYRSIMSLFSQEVPSLVLKYASSVSVTAISLTYSCLWWSECWLGERYVQVKKTHYAVTLCHLIYLLWIFDFPHYALLFLPNSNICDLDSELPCKRSIKSRKLLLTLCVLSQTGNPYISFRIMSRYCFITNSYHFWIDGQ